MLIVAVSVHSTEEKNLSSLKPVDCHCTECFIVFASSIPSCIHFKLFINTIIDSKQPDTKPINEQQISKIRLLERFLLRNRLMLTCTTVSHIFTHKMDRIVCKKRNINGKHRAREWVKQLNETSVCLPKASSQSKCLFFSSVLMLQIYVSHACTLAMCTALTSNAHKCRWMFRQRK